MKLVKLVNQDFLDDLLHRRLGLVKQGLHFVLFKDDLGLKAAPDDALALILSQTPFPSALVLRAGLAYAGHRGSLLLRGTGIR